MAYDVWSEDHNLFNGVRSRGQYCFDALLARSLLRSLHLHALDSSILYHTYAPAAWYIFNAPGFGKSSN